MAQTAQTAQMAASTFGSPGGFRGRGRCSEMSIFRACFFDVGLHASRDGLVENRVKSGCIFVPPLSMFPMP